MTARMRFYLLLCVLVLLVFMLFALAPNPFDGRTKGAFYYQLDFAWCLTPYACIHESGHMVDEQRGWISESAEYQLAIANVRDTNRQWRNWILDAPEKNKYQEIYAEMYYIYLTNPNTIPQELEQFYQ